MEDAVSCKNVTVGKHRDFSQLKLMLIIQGSV